MCSHLGELISTCEYLNQLDWFSSYLKDWFYYGSSVYKGSCLNNGCRNNRTYVRRAIKWEVREIETEYKQSNQVQKWNEFKREQHILRGQLWTVGVYAKACHRQLHYFDVMTKLAWIVLVKWWGPTSPGDIYSRLLSSMCWVIWAM